MALIAFLQVVLTIIIIGGGVVLGVFLWKNVSTMYRQIVVTVLAIICCIIEVVLMKILSI